MQKKIVILLGAPGSGKGTQAQRLAGKLHIPHISTGDLFRYNLKNNTALGKKAKAYMEAGALVPDELVLEMLFDRVVQSDAANGYLLDGFPRTIPQARALETTLDGQGKIVVLNLEVGDTEIVRRVTGRVTCNRCGKIYHKFFSPPHQENQCDACSGPLYQRSDDTADVVKERLRVYHDQTEPLVEYYSDKGVLSTVDGTMSPDQVFNKLLFSIGV